MWCIQEFVCYVYTSENRKKMTRYFAPNLTSNSRLFAARQQSPLSKYHMICWQDQSTSKWAVKMLQIDCSLFSRLLFQQQQKSNLWNMDIVVFPAAGTGFNHQRSYDMLVFINTWILWGDFMLLTCVLTHYLPASTVYFLTDPFCPSDPHNDPPKRGHLSLFLWPTFDTLFYDPNRPTKAKL